MRRTQILYQSYLHLQTQQQIKFLDFQVCIHSQIYSIKPHSDKPFSTNLEFQHSNEKPISYTEYSDLIYKTHALINPSVIVKSLSHNLSYLWENQKNENFVQVSSLKEILLKLSDISPESIRGFWRVSGLRPHDVHQILLGFNFDCGNFANEKEKVGFLWELFNLASQDFQHLPQSYVIMASMLIRVGLLKEGESVLRIIEPLGVLSGCHDISSELIEGYVRTRDLESSVSAYNWLRSQGLVLSNLCYKGFIELLIEMNKIQVAYKVFVDMVDVGIGPNDAGKCTLEVIVKSLCKEWKIQKARNLVKKVISTGFKPSYGVVNLIANGYCEKKDFKDLLNFLSERKCAPDPAVCNKILQSQCRDFGTEEAYLFMRELEHLGYKPDEITFGIFISWSCREGKLKDAFIYLSELLSRQLEPDIYSYNALIAGLFKEGMWKNAKEVYDEMIRGRIILDVSTCKVLLAGYCKSRRFDEVKEVIKEMVNHGLIQLSMVEDPLSKAFTILGLDPLTTKVKRDNDAVLSKAEFFDNLGNGLYLEADVDEYERTLMGVLKDAVISDFNPLILKECDLPDIKAALVLTDDIVRRGKHPSLSAFSALVKGLCESGLRSDVVTAIHLLEEMPDHVYRLDVETLNFLIRAISKIDDCQRGRILLEGMHQRSLVVENKTYGALFIGFCKKKSVKEVHEFFELARRHKWLPSLKDSKSVVRYLCQQEMFQEMLGLLESMLDANSHLISDLSNVFLEELCDLGFTSIGQALVEEVLRWGLVLDRTAYSHLIRGFCQEGRFLEAFSILETLVEKGITPSVDAYGLLIYQLCRFDKLEKARALKEVMLREESTASLSVYGAFVDGLSKNHQISEATLQFQEMVAKGIYPKTGTYNAMIQGYCRADNLRKVRELVSNMVRKNICISISSYRDLLRLMCSQGKVLCALKLKDYMVTQGYSSLHVFYNILIFHLLRIGNILPVTSLLDEMHRKGLYPDEFTYNFLVYGYYKCREFPKSMVFLKTMIDKDLRPNNRSLKSMITHLCSQKELDEALELSRIMEFNGWNHGSIIQNAIVEGLLSKGRIAEAEDFLKRMEEKGLNPNKINYDILIKQFCWHKKPNKATDLLNEMLKKGNLPNSTSYDALIHGLCTRKKFDEALDLHAEMLGWNLEPSIKSREILVQGLCTEGQTVEAERLLHCMLQLGQTPSRTIFQHIIDRYSLENCHSKVSELLIKMQGKGYVPDFNTQWSLISNLSNSKKENGESGGFLSNLLSLSGFSQKKKSNVKVEKSAH
ncbi:pentatricopeptide repeat-containing protein At5g15280, mitochondrial-like [Papaver somniferum]|uniref:pentatricopeptide repeat-containing protein At5g15280, mitochondrial-like n=1 Tax=Papaver somniferum TaxID=3469 RepID=UPI000E6F8214|nr:pentatricopeptide repeat-containing protein At5g15280, mitochondrial-like [Papaver somniferum]XP_026421965.1 pentatricopeptide repeat-containing protein At5g15280, mitochondrial-like [Papaver somniferum]XP_026421966.1 pentatricopeptide repeat-containing protein At5g15280, mitochondrial-like [Papaver somniferum]XP_026421968.1 pentatricopeptide repeat-containing protein At5g15280, mitochondrial-like [Papaver somniferum]XP_026421969.1 pentatricopeptide repeat-containing protein At5g15280, mitoc